MDFQVAAHTDVGISKNTNQDSLLVKLADTPSGSVCFTALCDGMGGLEKGELASATVIRALDEWFEHEFPYMLSGFEPIRQRLSDMITMLNGRIANYGKRIGVNMGTTLTAMLIADGRYLIVHVGDCRVYAVTEDIRVLTKDQTVVAREVERGLLTEEEAERDPRRNVLLQCIGASSVVAPAFYEGSVKGNESYLLCSDGFRHEISAEEIFSAFQPEKLDGEKRMEEAAARLTALCKARKEADNISVVMIKTV